MNAISQLEEREVVERAPIALDPLRSLLERPTGTPGGANIVIGELIAIADGGRVPLVSFPGQPTSAAAAARSTIDLYGPHVGRHVVLAFEDGDPASPIIVGLLRGEDGWAGDSRAMPVDVECDGARLVVSAREQLVLRCGLASITLSSNGEVSIKGTHVSSHSGGVNRIKGGSVQIN